MVGLYAGNKLVAPLDHMLPERYERYCAWGSFTQMNAPLIRPRFVPFAEGALGGLEHGVKCSEGRMAMTRRKTIRVYFPALEGLAFGEIDFKKVG